ncbi:CopG family transcriptional regulator [Haloarcula argentinensis]|uniref:CopG family transcriptional regulator n=1 Tax=Haloarcula argentinensis TaxID=43776 RepID=A0A847UQB0_HALAR|nr:CopG family transcriptional regulator [Haloarcula argentinensis]NLV14431.1 CopG family transcriptional regulator [Haloarcula argentinensis]
MPHANVTVGMEPSMLADIEDERERHGMSRAEYIRHCIRQAQDSPFEVPETILCADENRRPEESETGAA